MSDPLPFTVPPVVKTVRVRAAPAQAFVVFTQRIGEWWPLATHHAGPDVPRSCRFEPRPGGRLYQVDEDGAERIWGRVAEWQPPSRVVFSWELGEAEKAPQIVAVEFSPDGEGTSVRLTHAGWEALGAERGPVARGLYDKGWAIVFGEHFRAAADST
jgi:uncharacterized protein YndB with AHSA1/START domain